MSKTRLPSFVIVCVLILLATLLVACGAAVSIQPTLTTAPSPTGITPVDTFTAVPVIMVVTSTPSPNAQEHMATAIVQAATETILALTPVASLCPLLGCDISEDERLATQIVQNATETSVALTRAVTTLDPAQMTATAVIAAATATVASEQTATGQALIGQNVPNSDQMTATEIIARASMTALAIPPSAMPPFATRTPYPPIPDEELELLRARWLDELETAVGFSHPALDSVIDGLVQNIPRANPHPNYIREFHLQSAVVRTEHDNSTYIAVITKTGFDWVGYSNLLLFRITDEDIVLLPDVLDMNGMGFSFTGGRFSNGEYLGGFADRNGNGYLDIAVDTDGGGSCGVQNLYLLEIYPDDQVVSLTSPIRFDGGVMVRNIVDVDDDGIMELEVMVYPLTPMTYGCHSLMMKLYYGWNGSAYEDISPTLDETYYPAIDAFWTVIDADTVCLLPNYEMYQMLIGYLALDRLEEGWGRLQRILHWEDCSTEVRTNLTTNYDMLNLVIWVGQHLPIPML